MTGSARRELQAAGIAMLASIAVGSLLMLIAGKAPGTVWWTMVERTLGDPYSLGQVLYKATALALTGLSVSIALDAGLFNIGGQGQYTMGIVVAVWVGTTWGNALPNGLHVVLGIVLAALAGAIWAGIAGILKATVGAHEVITTIMLNWIAFWFASYCFGQGGPLQNTTPGQESVPISDDVSGYAREVTAKLRAAGIRAVCDERSDTLNYRIRDGEVMKVPYMAVCGKREAEMGQVAVRVRGEGKKQDVVGVDAFVARVTSEIRSRALTPSSAGAAS